LYNEGISGEPQDKGLAAQLRQAESRSIAVDRYC
jgi:hypothetical protein